MGNPSPSPSLLPKFPFVFGQEVAVGHAGHGGQEVSVSLTKMVSVELAAEVVGDEAMVAAGVDSIEPAGNLISVLLKQFMTFNSATSPGRLKVTSTHYLPA
jgi:hypothetical protein